VKVGLFLRYVVRSVERGGEETRFVSERTELETFEHVCRPQKPVFVPSPGQLSPVGDSSFSYMQDGFFKSNS